MSEKEYYSYLNSMRGILMILGVIIHAAAIYEPEQHWLVKSLVVHPFYSYLSDAIHLFRMPSFFIVSGFFCCMVLSRSSVIDFLKKKLHRIFIPLVFVGSTFNVVQGALLGQVHVHDFFSYFTTGTWVGHLWFLVNLLVYFALAAFLKALVELFKCDLSMIKTFSSGTPIYIWLLLLPFTKLGFLSLSKLGVPIYGVIFNIFYLSSLLEYIPYFCFGILLYMCPALHEKYRGVSPFFVIFLILLGVIFHSKFSGDESFAGRVLYEYFGQLAAWASTSICFYFCYKYLNKSWGYFEYAVDGSYTTYLVHHFIVVCVGFFLSGIFMSVHLKFLVVSLITLMLCYAFHFYVVRRSALLLYLINGR